jgi:hypothetical protein
VDQEEFNRMLKEALKENLAIKIKIDKDYTNGDAVISCIHVSVEFLGETILSDYDYV